MDEPAQNEDIAVDFAGDETQPTAEITAALNNTSSNSIKTEPDSDHPTSEFDTLFARLSENPHDQDGWRRLIDVATSSGEISKVRQAYDELLRHYPNTSSAQIAYISHFLNDKTTFPEAEHLFIKFLRTSPNVDLWKFYLTYVRRVNNGPTTREIVRKSYEFALGHVGQDKDSGEIWNDYIQFLKAGDASSTWEEQQKMDNLRKAYHRAVQIPLDNVERLWSELEAFETNLNKITAKKFMSDLSPAHMQARAVLRQLTSHLNPLYPPQTGQADSNVPDLYLPSFPNFDAADRSMVGKWKAYLKWEESNPLEIEEKEKATLVTRIQGVYRKAVIRMRFYAEVWFMAYTWMNSIPTRQDDALAILKAGLDANPSSYLLTFAYAEAMEMKKEYADVHATFDKFLTTLAKGLDELEKTSPPPPAANGTTNGNATIKDPSFNETQSTSSSFNSQSDEKPPKTTELQERRTEYGLGYIMYMRFARRAEGLQSLRKVFGKARKDRWAPWEVYEASALMEYHCFDDKNVASRIFEKGLETFGDEIDYVCRYLGFLISINDGNNARALFERVVPTFPPDRARQLWERWARYEYQYGDLEAALKLEKRILEVYPQDPPIKRFAQRHIYLGTDAIAARDLGFALARRHNSASASALGRTETGQSLGVNSTGSASKRPASPDQQRGGKREERNFEFNGGYNKRARGGASPARLDRDVSMREREREHGGGGGGGGAGRDRGDRWGDGGSRGRRFSPPSGSSWDKDREREDRDGGGAAGGRGGYGGPSNAANREIKREESFSSLGPSRGGSGGAASIQVPPILSWFIGELPPAPSFDGPIFNTEDLMKCFKQAIMPSSAAGGATNGAPPRARSPPPSSQHPHQHHRGGGRPPPDYGPYQGPGGGRGRRY